MDFHEKYSAKNYEAVMKLLKDQQYTEDDMRKCFDAARLEAGDGLVYTYFEDYIKTLKT